MSAWRLLVLSLSYSKTPNQVVAERLQARRPLVNTKTHGRAGHEDIAKARLIVESAKEVSQLDNYMNRERRTSYLSLRGVIGRSEADSVGRSTRQTGHSASNRAPAPNEITH